MISPLTLDILVVAALTATACALVGTFLMLRRMAMMSDAISHSILLGIVVGFFLVRSTTHPLVIVSAALTGVLTVALVEAIVRTRLAREDAAIGLVFPFLFSIAVLLVNRYAGNVHLDQDAVLLGELVFVPFNRLTLFGLSLPAAAWTMGGILLLDALLIALFYKELKLVTFDAGLAAALGFSPALIHYGLMTLVSLTAVGAFDAVGAVLVVALMVAPPAAAFLLTERLAPMLAIAVGIALFSTGGGYLLAHLVDGSIAGAMATVTGVVFLASFLLAPQRGLLAQALRRRRQREGFAVDMLLVHLAQHEGTAEEAEENAPSALGEHLGWPPERAERVLATARARGLVAPGGPSGVMALQPAGRARARGLLGSDGTGG